MNGYSYFRLAQECELRAIDVKSDGDRRQLLQLAEQYRRMAAESNVTEFAAVRRRRLPGPSHHRQSGAHFFAGAPE